VGDYEWGVTGGEEGEEGEAGLPAGGAFWCHSAELSVGGSSNGRCCLDKW
jgi:hypothetical protein